MKIRFSSTQQSPVHRIAAMRGGIALIIGLIAGLIAPAYSQDTAPLTLTSQVDRSKITIGDLITYRITVSRLPEVEVEWPGLGSNLGAFEIRDYDVLDPREADGRILEEVRYTISTFDTGAFVIPPLAVRYFTPPDSVRHELQTEPLDIYVASLMPSIEGDIRGLKPQEELPPDYSTFIIWGLAGLLLLLLAVGTWLYLRYRKRGRLALFKPEPPPRPAHEVALEALRALEAEQLFEQGRVKEHFSRLADIVRAYLDGRFFIPALEMTTFEILAHENLNGQLDEQRRELESLLNICDLVKFAKYVPDPEEHRNALTQAYRLVESTKLVYAEPQEAGEAEQDEDRESPSGATQHAGAQPAAQEKSLEAKG